MKAYLLKEECRNNLKQNFGTCIFGSKEKVIKLYNDFISKNSFKKIITVGDYSSLTLFSHVKIFDLKNKRKTIKNNIAYSLSSINYPGTINKKAFSVIKKAIKNNENVFVQGEEDLLLIPAVLLSNNNTLIIYGIPDKGIALIEVDSKIKQIFKDLLKKCFTELS